MTSTQLNTVVYPPGDEMKSLVQDLEKHKFSEKLADFAAKAKIGDYKEGPGIRVDEEGTIHHCVFVHCDSNPPLETSHSYFSHVKNHDWSFHSPTSGAVTSPVTVTIVFRANSDRVFDNLVGACSYAHWENAGSETDDVSLTQGPVIRQGGNPTWTLSTAHQFRYPPQGPPHGLRFEGVICCVDVHPCPQCTNSTCNNCPPGHNTRQICSAAQTVIHPNQQVDLSMYRLAHPPLPVPLGIQAGIPALRAFAHGNAPALAALNLLNGVAAPMPIDEVSATLARFRNNFFAFKKGATTNWTMGRISSCTFSTPPYEIGISRITGALAANGDSGGAWFAIDPQTNRACLIGIHSASGPNEAVVLPYDISLNVMHQFIPGPGALALVPADTYHW